MAAPAEWVVDFATLGFLAADWVEAHCPVPDREQRGQPFVMYDWELWCTLNHYRVRPRAKLGQKATAFHNRRSQVVGPQKCGKGPWTAGLVCLEAVGPALFGGFAGEDDGYVCADHGCGCGWEWPYRAGEPMGRPWVTPLIQITARSEDQTDNIYRHVKAMIRLGPLADVMRVGEEFTRCPNDGKIEIVTAEAQSRLGNPVTFVPQDETGLYTKANGMQNVARVQRRGAAGMGGRVLETTNAWDPAQNSVAQQTAESRATDIFRFHRLPPAHLKYTNKADRRKIHKIVYASSDHIDLDGIEAEAFELIEKDPAEAERFFGNRIVAGLGSWLPAGLWESREADYVAA